MEIRPLDFLDETMYWGRSGKQATVLEMQCVLTQKTDPEALKDALLNALKVHTNFRIRPVLVNRRFHAKIDDVTKPPVYREDGRSRCLGTEETEGLMLYLTYGNFDFTLHIFHGIADFKSFKAFLHTLLKFYCTALGAAEIACPRPDSMDGFPCYEEILKKGAPGKPVDRIKPEELDVFHLPEKCFDDNSTKQRLLEIDLPLKPFLAFARANNSSVVPALNSVIGHAIRQSYDVKEKDIVCYVPIDLRPVFHFESGGNGVTNFVLQYSEETDQCSTGERAMRLRTQMETQIRKENLYVSVAELKGTFDRVFANELPVERVSGAIVMNGRKKDAARYTYGISYGGNINFEAKIDPYIASVTASAGSYSYPLWIIACEYNRIIRMRLVQSFDSDQLAKNIYREFAELIPGTDFKDLGYHVFGQFPLENVMGIR